MGLANPANDFVPPTTYVDAREVYDRLTLVAMYLRPGERLVVDPGCASRDEGKIWIPLVIARVGAQDFYLSPAAARELAVRIAANPQFDVVFGDAAKVGLSFSKAADEAEDLAAGHASSSPQQEMH